MNMMTKFFVASAVMVSVGWSGFVAGMERTSQEGGAANRRLDVPTFMEAEVSAWSALGEGIGYCASCIPHVYRSAKGRHFSRLGFVAEGIIASGFTAVSVVNAYAAEESFAEGDPVKGGFHCAIATSAELVVFVRIWCNSGRSQEAFAGIRSLQEYVLVGQNRTKKMQEGLKTLHSRSRKRRRKSSRGGKRRSAANSEQEVTS